MLEYYVSHTAEGATVEFRHKSKRGAACASAHHALETLLRVLHPSTRAALLRVGLSGIEASAQAALESHAAALDTLKKAGWRIHPARATLPLTHRVALVICRSFGGWDVRVTAGAESVTVDDADTFASAVNAALAFRHAMRE